MSKHKPISKRIRQQVYAKYNGHCAYCGCKLDYKDMQVDHIYSIYHAEIAGDGELFSTSDLKDGEYDLETFRKDLETTLLHNTAKPFQFRLAEKYGVVERHPHKIRFFFEEYDQKKEEKNV